MGMEKTSDVDARLLFESADIHENTAVYQFRDLLNSKLPKSKDMRADVHSMDWLTLDWLKNHMDTPEEMEKAREHLSGMTKGSVIFVHNSDISTLLEDLFHFSQRGIEVMLVE